MRVWPFFFFYISLYTREMCRALRPAGLPNGHGKARSMPPGHLRHDLRRQDFGERFADFWRIAKAVEDWQPSNGFFFSTRLVIMALVVAVWLVADPFC